MRVDTRRNVRVGQECTPKTGSNWLLPFVIGAVGGAIGYDYFLRRSYEVKKNVVELQELGKDNG